MKAEILDILNSDGTTEVVFRCACGEAAGRWDGVPPLIGDVRHVELACDDELEPGVNAGRASRQAPFVRRHAGRVEITARLLARYEEGTVLLGFDDGRLEMEAIGDDFWCVDNWYTITVDALALYDMNL